MHHKAASIITPHLHVLPLRPVIFRAFGSKHARVRMQGVVCTAAALTGATTCRWFESSIACAELLILTVALRTSRQQAPSSCVCIEQHGWMCTVISPECMTCRRKALERIRRQVRDA